MPLETDNLKVTRLRLAGPEVRLPLFGPLVLPPKVGSYDMGLFKTPAGQLHVSAGLGTSTIPVRVNCRPEITTVEV